MKKQTSVFWFYSIIAALCFVIIFGMQYWAQLSKERAQRYHQEQRIKGLTSEEIAEFKEKERTKFSAYGFHEDLSITLQDGREINIKDELAGKVVVLVQYFSG